MAATPVSPVAAVCGSTSLWPQRAPAPPQPRRAAALQVDEPPELVRRRVPAGARRCRCGWAPLLGTALLLLWRHPALRSFGQTPVDTLQHHQLNVGAFGDPPSAFLDVALPKPMWGRMPWLGDGSMAKLFREAPGLRGAREETKEATQPTEARSAAQVDAAHAVAGDAVFQSMGDDWEGTDEAELRFARERLLRQFNQQDNELDLDNQSPYWAVPEPAFDLNGRPNFPKVGSVLLAHPEPFHLYQQQALRNLEQQNASGSAPKEGDADDPAQAVAAAEWAVAPEEEPAASYRTGILPALSDATRREKARLPVVLITEHNELGTEGLLLGLWSGKLLGDMGFDAFMTRPLYVGGAIKAGLAMLHSYPELPGAKNITSDGLAMSMNFSQALDWITYGTGTSLRFKFFIYKVRWPPGELEKELEQGTNWLHVRCSRDLLMREPDSSFEEPLWVQIAEYAGGAPAEAARDYSLLPGH